MKFVPGIYLKHNKMKKSILFAIAIVFMATSSCKKKIIEDPIQENPTTSFTMTYDGVTYTGAEAQSLNLTLGMIAVVGHTPSDYWLNIQGVPGDGETWNICVDANTCTNVCKVLLDFGASAGQEGFVAESGTVSRNGHVVTIDVTGHNTALEAKSLSATITVGNIIL